MISKMMDSFTEAFCFMERTHEPDGEGGNIVRWKDGMKFSAAIRHDTTILAQQAEAQGTASTFTLLIPKGISAEYPDVVKRLSDGETFQITSSAADSQTPAASQLKLAMVTARKWRLP